jgi:fumarate reductase subunit D
MSAAVQRARKVSWRSRSHPAYWAFLLHRVSGLLLALFLPAHFWVLGLALEGELRLGAFLRWTDQPLVKVAETMLIALLAAHLTGGIRILILEFSAWRPWQKSLLPVALGTTLFLALAFALALIKI